MPVRYIPQGYQHITPYLTIKGAADAIRFYQEAFGAKEVQRFENNGLVGHAEILIADCKVMLGEEMPEWGATSPKTLGGTPTGIHLYVEDVDRAFEKALKAGGTQVHAVSNQFYGDRSGTLVDPFGHKWTLATHIEDVAPDELQRRFREFMAQMAQAPTAEPSGARTKQHAGT